MPAVTASPLEVVIGIVLFWMAVGFMAVFEPQPSARLTRIFYGLGAAAGVLLAAVGLFSIGLPWKALVLPFGLPDLPFHARLDALSSFFLFLLGATAAGVSCYAAGYFSGPGHKAAGLTCLLYHWFL